MSCLIVSYFECDGYTIYITEKYVSSTIKSRYG